MATVGDILRIKGTEVLSVAPEATVLDAAQRMNEHGAGSVLVVAGEELLGIFTERDVLRRVVAARRDPAATPVGDVMTTKLVTCEPATDTESCAHVMSDGHIRHMPVLAAGRLAGLVTSGDLLAHQLRDQASTIQQLQGFIFDGR
jgi:CBS domain-containing protein